MNHRLPIIALTLIGFGAGYTAPANAIGCISGGLAGAVAGHLAHHGVLGAIGGCVAGHQINKHQKNAAAAQRQSNTNDQSHSNDGSQPNRAVYQNE